VPGAKETEEVEKTRDTQFSIVSRGAEIQRQIHQLSDRDLQLWSIGILVIIVLTAGLLALILPNLVPLQRVTQFEHAYLPQLFFGLISLVLLFNVYLMRQKFALNSTRRSLISQLVFNERLENLSMMDPHTQTLNRRAIYQLIPREVSRANRLGSNLTFLIVDLDGFQALNEKLGQTEGDIVLFEFARLLKTIFRGGDAIFRQGGDEFLLVMPDTNEKEADFPLQRLQRTLAEWNRLSDRGYELSFSWSMAAHVPGDDFEDVLRTLDRKLYQKKHNLVPVF
jgi:diguanylate cyclase (GGDEF)-like protein